MYCSLSSCVTRFCQLWFLGNQKQRSGSSRSVAARYLGKRRWGSCFLLQDSWTSRVCPSTRRFPWPSAGSGPSCRLGRCKSAPVSLKNTNIEWIQEKMWSGSEGKLWVVTVKHAVRDGAARRDGLVAVLGVRFALLTGFLLGSREINVTAGWSRTSGALSSAASPWGTPRFRSAGCRLGTWRTAGGSGRSWRVRNTWRRCSAGGRETVMPRLQRALTRKAAGLTSYGWSRWKGTEQVHGLVPFQLKFWAQVKHGLDISTPV